jgi:hypothetical protein
MSFIETLNKMANRFERKLSLAQQTEQAMEAPDFFFGVGYNLSKFVQSLGNLSVENNQAVGTGSLAKLLADFWNKTNQSASVKVSCHVDPGKGARWVVNITPQGFVAPAMAELNKQYQNLTGRSWAQGQADADKQAKTVQSVHGDFTRVVVDMGV